MDLESMTYTSTQPWAREIMSFGDRVREIRTQQGLTAKELSTLSGVPEKTIYRIETGEVADPKLSTIEPLVKALNCSADELIFTKDSFTKLGQLRQYFLNITDLHDFQQDFILEVLQKLILAASFEKKVSEIGLIPVRNTQPSLD